MAHIEYSLQQVKALMHDEYPLAQELIGCGRLVKGYSDTHARGSSKFDKHVPCRNPAKKGRSDAAADLAVWRAAALTDPQGGQTAQRWGLLLGLGLGLGEMLSIMRTCGNILLTITFRFEWLK